MTTTDTGRRLHYCDVCGQLDDHPKHVIGVTGGAKATTDLLERIGSFGDAPATAVAQLLDPTTYCRHMDCCASLGCDVCAGTEAVNGGRRGQALIDHLNTTREEPTNG